MKPTAFDIIKTQASNAPVTFRRWQKKPDCPICDERGIYTLRDGRAGYCPCGSPVDMDLSGWPPLEVLSTREREVLALVAAGLKSNEIAARLGLARKTIETHRKNIAASIGVRGTAQLTKFAVVHGLATLEAAPGMRENAQAREAVSV